MGCTILHVCCSGLAMYGTTTARVSCCVLCNGTDAPCRAMLCCAAAVAKKIPIKGVATFQPCPADKPLLAAFIAESKGQPAVATVLDCSGDQPVTISRKSFYRATGACACACACVCVAM